MLLLGGGAVLGLVALSLLWRDRRPLPAPSEAGSPPVASPTQPASAAQPAAGDPSIPAPREALPPALRVIGRVVAADGGAPVAGCRIALRVGAPSLATEAAYAQSDEDGRFELTHDRFAPDSRLRVDPPQHRPEEIELRAPPAAGVAVDLGELRLQPGTFLTGHVVETGGGLVRDLRVTATLFQRTLTVDGQPQEQWVTEYATAEAAELPLLAGGPDRLELQVDLDGRFRSDRPGIPGSYRLHCASREFDLLDPRVVRIPEQGLPAPFALRVRARPKLSGRLVDPHGSPLRGITISATEARRGKLDSTTTAADGAFLLCSARPASGPIRLELAADSGFELLGSGDGFRWGAAPLTLVARRLPGARLSIHARNSLGLLTKIEALQARWLRIDGSAAGTPKVQFGDRITLIGLPHGEIGVVVVPLEPGLRPSRSTRLQIASDEPIELTVDCVPMLPINVRVLDPARRPLRGATVDCLDFGRNEFPLDGAAISRTELLTGPDPFGATVELGRAETDGEGYVTIGVPFDGAGAALRVRAPGFAAVRVPCPERFEPDTEIEVVLQRAR
jgi:hypothetical protein